MFEEFKPSLVVYDMLQHVLPPKVNMNSLNEVATAFKPIKLLAEKYKTCVLFIQHTSKFSSSNGGNSVNFAVGSVGINGIFRTIWTVGQVKDDDGKPTNIRGLAISKSNIGTSDLPCLLFSIDSNGFSWAGTDSDLTAESLVYTRPRRDLGRPNKRNEAAEYIQKTLSKGSRLVSELRNEVEMAFGGINERTFRRALRDAGAETEKDTVAGGYVCKLAG